MRQFYSQRGRFQTFKRSRHTVPLDSRDSLIGADPRFEGTGLSFARMTSDSAAAS
jgi:hypothetical protein